VWGVCVCAWVYVCGVCGGQVCVGGMCAWGCEWGYVCVWGGGRCGGGGGGGGGGCETAVCMFSAELPRDMH